MPNYVQLGQGLRDMGQSLSAGYDFLNDQKQLGISQQNADTNTGRLKIEQEQQAEQMRLQRNKESTGKLVSVFQGAIQSGDGSFQEHFAKNKPALDTALNAWVTSNSQGREAVGGKPVTGILGDDGKFGIHTVNADGSTAPLVVNGQEYRVDGDQIYRMGLTEMAANGRLEVISGLKALEAKKATMPPEEFATQRQALVQRMDQIQTAADNSGVDTNAIASGSAAAGQRHAAVDNQQKPVAPASAAVPPPMLSATPTSQVPPKPVSLGDATVGRFFPASVGATPATPDAPTSGGILSGMQQFRQDNIKRDAEYSAAYDAEHPVADTSPYDAVINDPNASTVTKLGARIGRPDKGVVDTFAKPFVVAGRQIADGVKDIAGKFTDGFNAGSAPTAAAKPAATPEAFIRNEAKQPDQTPESVVQKTQAQLTANPPRSEAHVKTIVKRGISTLSAPPKQDSAGTGTRDAYVYSMGMIGMGLQPDKDVIGNLMAGDTFNGYNADKRKQDIDVWKEQNANNRFAAGLDLQYAQLAQEQEALAVKYQGNRVQSASNMLEARKQTIKERENTIKTISQAYGFGKDKSTFDMNAAKFEGQLTSALYMVSGEAAKQGYNMNTYLTQLTTEPAFVSLTAKWLDRDMKAAKNNKGMNWKDMYRVAPTDLMLKVHSMRDPNGAKASFIDAHVKDSIDGYIQKTGKQPGKDYVDAEVQKANASFTQRIKTVDAAELHLENTYE